MTICVAEIQQQQRDGAQMDDTNIRGNENVERSNSKPKISATSKYSLTLTQTPIVDKYLFIAR